jgi:hypothetical protein
LPHHSPRHFAFIAHQPFWLFSPDLFRCSFYSAITWSPSYRSASLYTRPIAATLLANITGKSTTTMATCFGDSSNHVYTSIPMSKSSSSSSNTSITTSPAETLEGLEGLKDIYTRIFVGIENMRKIVKSESDKLQKGDSDQQYLVFARVSVDDLTKIDGARNRIGKGTRMTHYTDTNLLIVKLPTAEHELAHGNLATGMIEKVVLMGIPARELSFVGATTVRTRGSSKEADSAYRPRSFRPNKTDWPTIVFESGLSETLRQLIIDADWWLRKSNGAVKVVIIISIKRGPQTLQIEKWELAQMTGRRPPTRAFPNTLNIPRPLIPTKIQEITIVQKTVTGAPLVLEFDKIFLRPAVLPETDITFTAQELLTWAAEIW